MGFNQTKKYQERIVELEKLQKQEQTERFDSSSRENNADHEQKAQKQLIRAKSRP